MFIYELSGCGFKSSCSHLNLRFFTFFEQGVPRHSGNYRVWIHSNLKHVCDMIRTHSQNQLKPENLETLFLLSALKMLIKSVSSYQAEIKYLEKTLLWFLDFATMYSYFNVQMCSISLLEIKSFVSLKIEFLLFWTRVQSRGGGVLQNFEGGCS